MNDLQRQRDFKLIKAAVAGNVTHVRELLREGANVNVDGDAAEFATFSKKTALHWSAKRGNWDVVRLLLDRGASVSIKDHYGETALESACYEVEQGRLASIPLDIKKRLEIPDSPSKNTLGKRLQDRFTNSKSTLERARKHKAVKKTKIEVKDVPPGILTEEREEETSKTLSITEMQGFTAIGPLGNGKTNWIEAPKEEVDMGGWSAKLYSRDQQERLGVDQYGVRSKKDMKSRVPTMSRATVHHVVERKSEDSAAGFTGNQLDNMSVGPISYKKDDEDEFDPVDTSLRRLIIDSDVMDGKSAFLVDKAFRTFKDAYSRQDLMRIISSPSKMEHALEQAIKVITNRKTRMPNVNDLDVATPTSSSSSSSLRTTTYSDHLNTPPHLNDEKTQVHVSRHGSIDIRHKMTPVTSSHLSSPSRVPLPMVSKERITTTEHVSRNGNINIVTPDHATLSAPKHDRQNGTLSGYLRNYLTSTIHCLRFYRLKGSTLFCYKSESDSNERAQIDVVDTKVFAAEKLDHAFVIKTAHSELTLQTCDSKSFMVWYHALQRATKRSIERDEIRDDPPPPTSPMLTSFSDDDDEEQPPPPEVEEEEEEDDDDDAYPPPPPPPPSATFSDDDEEQDDPPPPPPPPSLTTSSIFTSQIDEFPLPPSHLPEDETEQKKSSSIPKRGSNVDIVSTSDILDIPKKRWIEIYGRESTLNVQRKCMLWADTKAKVKDLNFIKSAVLLEDFRVLNPKSRQVVEDPPEWWPLECLK